MKIKAFFRLVIHTVGQVERVKPDNLSEPGFTGLSDFQDYSHLRISGKVIRIPQRTYSQQGVNAKSIWTICCRPPKIDKFRAG